MKDFRTFYEGKADEPDFSSQQKALLKKLDLELISFGPGNYSSMSATSTDYVFKQGRELSKSEKKALEKEVLKQKNVTKVFVYSRGDKLTVSTRYEWTIGFR
jgi:hypothetical protein